MGINNWIDFVEWASQFCKFQVKDYPIDHSLKQLGCKNLAKQDYSSTTKMAKGGRRTCGKRTRCIEIKFSYFYITEKSKDGLIVMPYSLIKEMVSNYLLKPLQWSLFSLHCNVIIGNTNYEYDRYELEYTAAKKRQTSSMWRITRNYMNLYTQLLVNWPHMTVGQLLTIAVVSRGQQATSHTTMSIIDHVWQLRPCQ